MKAQQESNPPLVARRRLCVTCHLLCCVAVFEYSTRACHVSSLSTIHHSLVVARQSRLVSLSPSFSCSPSAADLPLSPSVSLFTSLRYNHTSSIVTLSWLNISFLSDNPLNAVEVFSYSCQYM